MNVLLVGKGGREHALAWRLSSSPSVKHVYVAPGNGGTATLHNVSNVQDVPANDYQALVSLSKKLGIGLVVVGPDDAIVDGIGGYFRDSGIPCFAPPSKEAAELEGSKTYAKDFMMRHGIPTAEYRSFDSHDMAHAYIDGLDHSRKVVIKVDGLAAGKGVILPATHEEAQEALAEIMLGGRFGSAGKAVVIEEYLDGDEISVLTFHDGKTSMTLPPGQDHKRIFEGNTGPNTGGMGVYAPVPFVTGEQMAEIEKTIVQPTFEGLKAEGRPFIGMLFTGVMLTSSGPKVLEYNVRFGDPETQSMLMLIANNDFASLLLACAESRLHEVEIDLSSGYACNVVVTSSGYPESYRQGDTITLDTPIPGVQIFHAGTEFADGKLRTAGGRVFSVAAAGATLEEAVAATYEGVKTIHFDGMFYRKDIASR